MATPCQSHIWWPRHKWDIQAQFPSSSSFALFLSLLQMKGYFSQARLGHQEVSSTTPSSKQGLLLGQISLLRASSSQILKTTKNREHNLLGQPHGEKSFSLSPVWTFPVLVNVHYLPVSQKAWIHLIINLHVGTGKLLLASPRATFSPGGTRPSPSACPLRASAWAPAIMVVFCWAHSKLSMSFC